MNYIASKRKIAWLKLLYRLHLIKGYISVDSGTELIIVKYFGVYYVISEKYLYDLCAYPPTNTACKSSDNSTH